MKKAIRIIALFAVLGYQGRTANVIAQHADTTRPVKVARGCSRQFGIPVEKYWNGLGARGSIRNNEGREWHGWALFDTGATYSRVRHPQARQGDDMKDNPINAKLSFGEWETAESLVLSPSIWNRAAPKFTGDVAGDKGHQIATIGTSIMQKWSVRIDDTTMFFSNLNQACTEDQLSSEGYIRLDTSGFYQLEGQQVSVSPSLRAPTIPTVWVEILGVQVLAQIDTGYQVKFGEKFVEVNQKLMDQLKSKLPPANKFGNFYIVNGGLIYLASKDSTKKIASVSNVYLSPKKSDGGGIAEWEIPAAMISAPAFFNAFASSEFRADKKSIWVKIR